MHIILTLSTSLRIGVIELKFSRCLTSISPIILKTYKVMFKFNSTHILNRIYCTYTICIYEYNL